VSAEFWEGLSVLVTIGDPNTDAGPNGWNKLLGRRQSELMVQAYRNMRTQSAGR
jgi:hypothetical protein